jgi:hypothetical protein
MSMISRVSSLLTVLFCLAGCAATVTHPVAEPRATPVLTERVARATQLREQIARSVEQEDAQRQGRRKTLLVADQVRAARDVAAHALPGAQADETLVQSYEQACAALEQAYLDSLLESTDPAQKSGAWAPDDDRDVLGSATVGDKLMRWQGADAQRPFAKFAVVREPDGSLQTRVGSLRTGHVDIAGGPALVAGLLRAELRAGKLVIVLLENTSGGFRPGPLRVRTALAALERGGFLPAQRSELTVHENPTGGYESSQLIHP